MYPGPLPQLLPNLAVSFHVDRKDSWYSIRTPDDRFIRIGMKEYLVACLLDGRRTDEEIVQAVKEIHSDCSLDRVDVMRIVDWLGKAGILMTNSSAFSGSHPASTWNPLFVRQDLISGPTMERIGRFGSVLVGRWFVTFALLLWVVATFAAFANWREIWTFSQKLLVPDSLLWWVAIWACLKIFHEFGHASFAVKYGCPIRSAGLSWMFFSPIPFVDVSGMWLNTNRLQRCLCCLGGLVFELTISSIAILAFLFSEVELVRYVCCMLFTMGAVSSIVVNGTPFMKFDGYHVLSEWLAWPNLYADGQSAVREFLVKIANPWRPAAKSAKPLLVIYGLTCAFYRFTFWLALLLGAFFAFHALGLFVVGGLILVYVLLPIAKQFSRTMQQRSDPGQPAMSLWQSMAYHYHSIAWCGFLALSIGTLICWMPSPWKPMIPGFIDYSHPHLIRNETEGFVSQVFVQPGDRVQQGDVLAILTNPILERDQRVKEIEVLSLREQAVLLQSQLSLSESQGVKAKLEAALEQLQQLQHKSESLTLLSPCDGKVVDSYLHERLGQFLKSGEDLGMITETEQLEVVGFVEQSEIDWFRGNLPSDIKVRLPEGSLISANLTEAFPRASEFLESPQLAASFGGPLSVEMEDAADGTDRWRLPKPRFKIKANLPSSHANRIRPGQTVGLYLPNHSISVFQTLTRMAEYYWDDFQRKLSSQ